MLKAESSEKNGHILHVEGYVRPPPPGLLRGGPERILNWLKLNAATMCDHFSCSTRAQECNSIQNLLQKYENGAEMVWHKILTHSQPDKNIYLHHSPECGLCGNYPLQLHLDKTRSGGRTSGGGGGLDHVVEEKKHDGTGTTEPMFSPQTAIMKWVKHVRKQHPSLFGMLYLARFYHLTWQALIHAQTPAEKELRTELSSLDVSVRTLGPMCLCL